MSNEPIGGDLNRMLGEYKHDDCLTCGTKVPEKPLSMGERGLCNGVKPCQHGIAWNNGCSKCAAETTGKPLAAQPMEPDLTGEDARYRDETNCADALAVWLSDHGSVWVTDEGEIAMRSRYGGGYVADWHGHAIVAAQRWCDTKMPVSVHETITAERAEYVPSGTVLVRVNPGDRIMPSQTVIVTGLGFTPSAKYRYRVLELPRNGKDPS